MFWSGENISWVNLHQYNQKHISTQLNGYGDTEARKLWSSFGSTYLICLVWFIICTLHRPVLKPIPKTRYAEGHVLCNVLGMLRVIFMKLVQVLYIFIQVSTLQEQQIPHSFHVYLVISKCTTALIL